MSEKTSDFIWYDLMTTDTVAAGAFYGAVVGWGSRDSGTPGVKYTLFTIGETGVAGMMKLDQAMCEAGARPGWLGYIAVGDTDATVKKITAMGGKTYCPPTDIPGVGRFATVADPHGAVFQIMTPMGERPAQWPAPGTQGLAGWRELHAGNGPEAWEFYSNLLGWTKAGVMDMGEMGVYQLFNSGDEMIGGMMTKMPDIPAPFWMYYFNVDDIDAAIERVKENGGQVLMGPHEVPGPMWIVQCADPQGAVFALVAGR